jgi:hypothetical protein
MRCCFSPGPASNGALCLTIPALVGSLAAVAPPPGTKVFAPIRPLYKVEHAFARLGR